MTRYMIQIQISRYHFNKMYYLNIDQGNVNKDSKVGRCNNLLTEFNGFQNVLSGIHKV